MCLCDRITIKNYNFYNTEKNFLPKQKEKNEETSTGSLIFIFIPEQASFWIRLSSKLSENTKSLYVEQKQCWWIVEPYT